MDKVGKLGNNKVSWEEFLSAGSEADKAGEQIGEQIGEGVTKGVSKKMKGFSLDFWGKAVAKGISDASIKGLKEPTGKDLSKVQNLPDINSISGGANKVNLWKAVLGAVVGTVGENPFIGSRILSDEFGKLKAGEDKGIVAGLFGKGGIAGFSEIYLAFKVFKGATKIFGDAVRIFLNSSEKASKYYSEALQNGLGLGFSIRRGTLAQIMGVSEKDVFRFGAQMAYLNPKISDAVAILQKTSEPLTRVNWEFKVLKLDMDALVSKLANDAAPAFLDFIVKLDNFLKMLQRNTQWIERYLNAVKFANPAYDIYRLNKAIGFGGKAIFNKLFPGGSEEVGNLPSPQSWMKQLPAAAWEKMGLVTMGGTQNYAKETARWTKETAVILKQLAANAKNHGQSTFGMSPLTSNP